MEKDWDADEYSSRNCYNCLVRGDLVYCRKGHTLVSISPGHKELLTYKGVVRTNRLLKPCVDCNDWEVNDDSNPYP